MLQCNFKLLLGMHIDQIKQQNPRDLMKVNSKLLREDRLRMLEKCGFVMEKKRPGRKTRANDADSEDPAQVDTEKRQRKVTAKVLVC